jgi:hypothetical protein
MNFFFITIFLLLTITTGYSMQADAPTPEWIKKIGTTLKICINTVHENIAKEIATTKAKQEQVASIAVVFEIDDICFLSPYSYEILSPYLNADQKKIGKKKFESFAIEPILTLFKNLYEQGITIFFVTSRPEKNPDTHKDAIDDHKKVLLAAGYEVDKERIFFKCLPSILFESEKTTITDICAWKKNQYSIIEFAHGYKIVAILDAYPVKHKNHIQVPNLCDYLNQ